MRQIPTQQVWTFKDEEHQMRFINYGPNNKSIFIIELNDKGNHACIQCNGTSCDHKDIKGFIFKEFKSKSKWFNPSWWYKKTCWGTKYPTKIYFRNNESKEWISDSDWWGPEWEHLPVGEERSRLITERFERSNKMCTERADKFAIPSSEILYKIMVQVWIHTKIQFGVDFEIFDYGTDWFEAYIPLTYKGKKYLLTWANCD